MSKNKNKKKASETLKVSFERSNPGLERLPDTSPPTLLSLMQSIDRKVQYQIQEMAANLALEIKEQMLKARVSEEALARLTGQPLRRIENMLNFQSLPDLAPLDDICIALSGRLRASLITKDLKVIHLDDLLHDQRALATFVCNEMEEKGIHSLPKMFFQTWALDPVPGLDGGYLEKSCPRLFRLMRHAFFMRCKLVLRVSFPAA